MAGNSQKFTTKEKITQKVNKDRFKNRLQDSQVNVGERAAQKERFHDRIKQKSGAEKAALDNRLKTVKQQGYKAARENKIQPRELSNVQGDRWEDAKVYSRDTRQGQNYNRQHMKEYAQALEATFGRKKKK